MIYTLCRERERKNEVRVLYSSTYWSQKYNILQFALNLALMGNAVLTAPGGMKSKTGKVQLLHQKQ